MIYDTIKFDSTIVTNKGNLLLSNVHSLFMQGQTIHCLTYFNNNFGYKKLIDIRPIAPQQLDDYFFQNNNQLEFISASPFSQVWNASSNFIFLKNLAINEIIKITLSSIKYSLDLISRYEKVMSTGIFVQKTENLEIANGFYFKLENNFPAIINNTFFVHLSARNEITLGI